MTVRLSSYDYFLPPELIAQHPNLRRDASRLFVLDRRSKNVEHRHFYDIISYLSSGDLLVLNDTKVLRARFLGRRKTGGQVEILLLRHLGDNDYEALIKPLGRLKDGELIELDKGFSCRLLDAKKKRVQFLPPGAKAAMKEIGLLPLPPYIRRRPQSRDRVRYQTVFASQEGAIAAPTAGLHFTKGLIKNIKKKGTGVCFLTLHVNYATFAPVRCDDLGDHTMEPEFFSISAETAESIRRTKNNGGRVIAVGTTVCKALEDSSKELLSETADAPIERESRLFIRPPFDFKVVDALITNFHLPRTTLLMLVSAFAGRKLMLDAYQEAVRERYRFYSYGDAMLIK